MLCFFSLAQLPRHFLSSPSRVCVRARTPDEEVSRQRTPKVKVSACAEDCVQSGRFPPQIWVPRPSLSSSWYTPTSPPSSRQSRPLLIPTLVDGSLRCQLEGLRVSSSSAKPTEATMLPRFPRADVVPPTSDVVPPTSNSKDERRRACVRLLERLEVSNQMMNTGAFSSMNIPKVRLWCSLISASLAPHERTASSAHADAFTLRRQNIH